MKRWRRGQGEALSPHFKAKEFECTDGVCSEQRIDMRLVERLEEVRVEIGLPLIITSAFRCANRQSQLRKSGIKTAVGVSTHEMGQAVDVTLPEAHRTAENMARLLELLDARFAAIGVAATFYHCDLRSDRKRRWEY